MYTNERFDLILDTLKTQKRAGVAQLSRLLYVSEATVRRDLAEMQRLGLLRRTHGGAIPAENTQEVAITIRQAVNTREKTLAAEIALPHLDDYRTIFLDNSSTCLLLVLRMDLRHKTVVTNNFQAALRLSQLEDVRVLMPGGQVVHTDGLIGTTACHALRDYRFDVMLSSCAAIDLSGSYENSPEVKELKSVALEQSDHRILVVDSTKFALKSVYRVAPLGAYDAVYTDADDTLVLPFQAAGLPLINR